jgi:hypothetical protein
LYRTGPVAALTALALVLASCGSGGSSTSSTGGINTSPASGGATGKGVPSHHHHSHLKVLHEREPGPGEYEAESTAVAGGGCESRIGEFVSRMDDLRQSLLAGLSYSEYVVRVRAIRDAYEAVPVDKLGLGCLNGAAGDAENAFNQYLRAANLWGECAGTAGCAASSIEERLQHRWRIASKSLEAAKRS